MSLADQIIGVESNGNPNARNPSSSASGLGQFIDSTWLNTIRSHRPDLMSRYNTKELLALKADPTLSREITAAYAGDNADYLRSKGLDTSPGSVYLAHFAGPQGAASLLSADDKAPVSTIMSPGAISANPFLRNMTVGAIKQWAARKMGGAQASNQQTNSSVATNLTTAPTSFDQFQSVGGASPATSASSTAISGAQASPSDAGSSSYDVPALIAQLSQQNAMPTPPPLHINYPTPPGLARAQMLARAMSASPLS